MRYDIFLRLIYIFDHPNILLQLQTQELGEIVENERDDADCLDEEVSLSPKKRENFFLIQSFAGIFWKSDPGGKLCLMILIITR